jgi:hypothetical protein
MTNEITRKQLMIEIAVKNVLILAIFWGFYTPMSVPSMLHVPAEILESVISLMGFLMAAAIIGAFELSYTRTNLNDKLQRYLAHLTKFMLYSSIMLLMEIALTAIATTGRDFIHIIIMAAMPVTVSLFLYDVWDALRALDSHAMAPGDQDA